MKSLVGLSLTEHRTCEDIESSFPNSKVLLCAIHSSMCKVNSINKTDKTLAPVEFTFLVDGDRINKVAISE